MLETQPVFRNFEDPIRSEIFTLSRLESHAISLAQSHRISTDTHRSSRFTRRVRDNGIALEKSFRAILRFIESQRAITPAAEWLVDNFHIVRAQLKDIHDHLPQKFYHELPKLSDGHLNGHPRVYAIAWAYIAHTDSSFDPQSLKAFLKSYQQVHPLTIGELWAVPITLRVVLIENLRRLGVRIVGSQVARQQADDIADEVLGLTGNASRPIEQIVKSLAGQRFTPSFAVQMLQRLRFQESRCDPLLRWLDQILSDSDQNPDSVVAIEHLSQTAANATVRNIITSARLMSSFNWQDFFEEVSLVEQKLRQNPHYSELDFSTRNRYRHAIEELARHSQHDELFITNLVVKKCQKATTGLRQKDPGYHLISSGRKEIEKAIKFRLYPRLFLTRIYRQTGLTFYLSFVGLFTLCIAALLFLDADFSLPIFWILFLLALLPASEIATTLVNRLTIAFLGPQYLPRLSLEEGIPAEHATFVVVPTLLTSLEHVDHQFEQLEIHYLSNPYQNLRFALLTDGADSTTESHVLDKLILQKARKKLGELNHRYPDHMPRFYMFHRRRIFNASEDRWMGWERKRGKLHEFNRLLLGESDTSFIPLDENKIAVPQGIRFVITLDSDTKLPTGAVLKLVGTLAHPLNRPRFNEKLGRVTHGYSILQPRVTPTLPSFKDSTFFQRLTTGDAGVDPYASAVSDIYQDLFGEGSFTGKGIYDLHSFHRALNGRVPENALLSHDLFEGSIARCGFISDVEFFEAFPGHTEVADSRSHRWTRGDWQLLPWIFGRGGSAISPLGRWKMIDNLRRSLLAPTAFLFLILSLAYIPHWKWVAFIFVSLSVAGFIGILAEFFSTGRKTLWIDHARGVGQDFVLHLARALMNFTMMVKTSWTSVDAIARTLYRVYFSRKKMLEWTTAAQTQASAQLSVNYFLKKYFYSLFLVIAAFVFVLLLNRDALLMALPLFVIWISAFLVARQISLPPKPRLIRPLKAKDREYLRLTGRQIWNFFSTFVTSADHHLPPDNFQETPEPVIAHRSSPTNFGLYLLSVLAARDFSWIGNFDTVRRLQLTIESLKNLPKFRGHFYNWYETSQALPLEPKYISSVDNGNLAGHLLAVAQGCLELLNEPLPIQNFVHGLNDGLLLIERAARENPAVLQKTAELKVHLESTDPISLLMVKRWQQISKLAEQLNKLGKTDPLANIAILQFSETFESLDQDIQTFFPWLKIEFPQNNLDAQSRLNLRLPIKELLEQQNLLLAELTRQPPSASVTPLIQALEASTQNAKSFCAGLQELHHDCHQLFNQMDFSILYDPTRKLFSIGYRVSDNALDASYYDLLASEARLTSFIAIAKGDVPASHWFHLGRSLTRIHQGHLLVSWSGSMFEYLMPSLVMREPEGSVIAQTCQLAVRRQIDYGLEKGAPWGISESAYNKRDLHMTYQYSNFGVPDLGLKRGLGADYVLAPYATILASMFDSAAGIENLRALEAIGARGQYGFYEAVDFTPIRLPLGQTSSVIKAYMAHHQGMSLVAIANIFKDGIMRDRFHAQALVQATELFLQERMPRNISFTKPTDDFLPTGLVREDTEHVSRQYHTVHRPVPATQLFSNGEYSLMLTVAGSGYSRCREIALTRWREDVTRDHWGHFIFIKDFATKKIWSAGFQPTCVEPDSYEVTFFEDRARYHRVDNGIASELEVFISPEENAEIRRLHLTNLSSRERELDLTSYAEVVLNTQNADVAHPTFSNLFIQTEFIPGCQTLLAWRRPRSGQESELWMAVVLNFETSLSAPLEWETDRMKFLGRGHDIQNAAAIYNHETLSGTTGSVLDPILSLRLRIKIAEGSSAHVSWTTVMGKTREEVLHMADKFHFKAAFERVAGLTWTQAQVKLHYYNMEPDEAHLFQRLATRLLYLDSSLRPVTDVVRLNKKDVTGLWAFGISGDDPIVLVRIDDFENRGIIRQLLKAHEYLASKGLAFDLVILNDQATSYASELQNSLEGLVQATFLATQNFSQRRGKVFVLRNDQVSEDDRALLFASARAVLSSRQGNLSEQVKRRRMIVDPHAFFADSAPGAIPAGGEKLPVPSLQFFNGLGGFNQSGDEYVICLDDQTTTPTPWSNVIANPDFGFLVTESGGGHTWSRNSRENQLTPWNNDPVADTPSEAFYILDRDEKSLWSPTAAPIRVPKGSYRTYHGQGYSRFEHISNQVFSELVLFVDPHRPVKISMLTLENQGKDQKRLAVFNYTEWLLGFSRATMAPHTVTEYDETTGAIFAINARNSEYGEKVAFAVCKNVAQSYTGDRTEFIGRNGTPRMPAGVFRTNGFSGKVGAAMDPCAAFRRDLTLKANEKKTLVFYLGQAENRKEARLMIQQLRGQTDSELLNVARKSWKHILEKVRVETPDPSFNLMINHWLLYQTLSSRFWARAGFYQAGGAFGFRDQLQDVMALMISQPHLARAHILRAASRQFIEGDVQHWWHPPLGRGVRTHFSDDLLWLPYVVYQYLKTTQDDAILDQEVPFLEGPLLRPDQEDSYYTPHVSHNTASLFNHCVRALDKSLKVGAHGLPLMGAGDWNDGMNRVGHGGKGESVWLAWFLYLNLQQFSEVAKRRGENEAVQRWTLHAQSLKVAAEKEAWDGGWYKRAFYDDGTPLGSAQNTECQIDSLSQTWAVISGAANPQRARQALTAVDEHLVDQQHKMILLFKPPFDKTPHDPGYIKGYLPGVRENGGQYTHAAIWCVIANAYVGDGDKANQLFSLLNPIHHGSTPAEVDTYKVEPYVLAADVYSQGDHRGRGGWTWYTGSCGWMYRAGLEYILGLRKEGNALFVKPCWPKEWDQCKITYKHTEQTSFEITVHRSFTSEYKLDLVDDGIVHTITLK